MKVLHVCKSIQSHGLAAGTIATTVRFCGCSLVPKDEPIAYADVPPDLPDVGPPFILEKALDVDQRPGYFRLAGGEPMEQPEAEMFSLLQSLSGWSGVRGLKSVTLMTNGHRDISALLDKPFRKILSIEIHLKPPSSGVCGKMLTQIYKSLSAKDTVVCRCRTEDDFDWVVGFLEKRASRYDGCRPTVSFVAADGEAKMWIANRLVDESSLHGRYDVRVSVDLRRQYMAR